MDIKPPRIHHTSTVPGAQDLEDLEEPDPEADESPDAGDWLVESCKHRYCVNVSIYNR